MKKFFIIYFVILLAVLCIAVCLGNWTKEKVATASVANFIDVMRGKNDEEIEDKGKDYLKDRISEIGNNKDEEEKIESDDSDETEEEKTLQDEIKDEAADMIKDKLKEEAIEQIDNYGD